MFRILVVDDDRDICWLISNILKDEGYSVDIAYDGKSAIKKVKKQEYNLMILDYNLPEISGLTVLEKVHQIKPLIGVIMISACADPSIKSRAKELGTYDFLDKSLFIEDANRFMKIVKKALAKKY